MALNISFGDFDTVCYDLQYNVMQLVKHCIGITIEINTQEEAVNTKLNELAQHDSDFFEILTNLYTTLNNLTQAMETQKVINSQLIELIRDLDDRVTALGG